MIFMNRKLFLISIFFLSNCSIVSYSEVIPLAKLAIIGADDIEITSEVIEAKKFSFAKVKIGRSAIAIFSLVKIDQNGSYMWISGEGEILTTFNGKIIKLENSLFNTEFISFSDFNLDNIKDGDEIQYDVMLYNPQAFVTQDASIQSSANNNNLRIIESVKTNGFRWSYQNEYLYNDRMRAIYARQIIHPKVPEIEINFYYK